MNDKYVENEYDTFTSELGFTRVSEDVGSSPSFQNADYVNKTQEIIVELKILQKEFFENGGVINSLNAIVIKPLDINTKGPGQYKFTLPNLNREGKHDDFEEPLRRILKKANRQLKETKKYYFDDKSSLGILLLSQVGFSQLEPDVTALVVQKIINQEFSSIDGVIICTPYSRSKNSITLRTDPICVSVTNEIDPWKKKKCLEIADKWVEFFEKGGHYLKK